MTKRLLNKHLGLEVLKMKVTVSGMQLVICTLFLPIAKFVNVLKLRRRIARLSKNMLESVRIEQI